MLIGRLSQMSPPPCLYDTVIQSYVQLKSGSIERTAHFMASYTIESQWGKFCTPPAPPGVQLYPILRYGLTEPASLFKCGKFHSSVKSTLWATRRQFFFAMLSQWGNFGTLLPPRGATFTPFWGWVLQSLPASSNVANFKLLWNPLSELRGVKSFSPC